MRWSEVGKRLLQSFSTDYFFTREDARRNRQAASRGLSTRQDECKGGVSDEGQRPEGVGRRGRGRANDTRRSRSTAGKAPGGGGCALRASRGCH